MNNDSHSHGASSAEEYIEQVAAPRIEDACVVHPHVHGFGHPGNTVCRNGQGVARKAVLIVS